MFLKKSSNNNAVQLFSTRFAIFFKEIYIKNFKSVSKSRESACFLKPCVFVVVQVAEGGRRRLLDDVSLAAEGAGAAGPQGVHLSNLLF